MRYSTYNAIPQYPKSKKHPYESLENLRFLSENFARYPAIFTFSTRYAIIFLQEFYDMQGEKP